MRGEGRVGRVVAEGLFDDVMEEGEVGEVGGGDEAVGVGDGVQTFHCAGVEDGVGDDFINSFDDGLGDGFGTRL